MNAVFALADRISVLIYGRILASGAPAPCGRTRRSSPPISARRLECHAGGRQTRSGLRTGAGAVRRELFRRRRRGRDPARPQRHGQDHDHPHSWACCRRRRHRAFDGCRLSGCRRFVSRRRARPCAGRPAGVSDAVGRGKSGRDRRVALRRERAGRSTASTTFSRAWPNGAATWATSCPAASSRCSRSAAR